jgi:hypothetical protein
MAWVHLLDLNLRTVRTVLSTFISEPRREKQIGSCAKSVGEHQGERGNIPAGEAGVS